MDDLYMQEIEEKVMTASPWQAHGEDGLPSMVLGHLRTVVKDRVMHLFQTSLRDWQVPGRWRQAKIVPLKNPGKGDYMVAKAWRPILLLSKLGKILKAVVAERDLVPGGGARSSTHESPWGARKKSAEQARLCFKRECTVLGGAGKDWV